MVAPEFTIQPRSAGSSAKLIRTPEGWRIFETVLLASMSQNLRSIVQSVPSEQMKPYNETERQAFDIVYSGLIQRLENESDLITLICDQCESGNGIHALSVLRSKFAGNTPAKSLSILSEMLNKKLFAPNVLVSAKRIIALNNQLAPDEQIKPSLLSALIVLKLPDSFTNLRDQAITGGSFPSTDTLLDRIEQLELFASASSEANVIDRKPQKFCFNCDTVGHTFRECSAEKLDCDICGPKAGHMAKHCLVKNGKEIPSSLPKNLREKIAREREAYAKKKTANTAEIETITAEPIIDWGGALASPPIPFF